jgi:hypothetical protein
MYSRYSFTYKGASDVLPAGTRVKPNVLRTPKVRIQTDINVYPVHESRLPGERGMRLLRPFSPRNSVKGEKGLGHRIRKQETGNWKLETSLW